MTGIPLRIAEPTGRYRRSLRRYRSARTAAGQSFNDCAAGGYLKFHNASTVLGVIGEADHIRAGDDGWPHDDARWPEACACGYVFEPEDCWQRNDDAIYHLPDGSEFAFSGSFGRCAPPGAMIRAPWYDEYAQRPGASWLISLPDGGDWITTQKASNGGGYWEVTGTPPLITVSPSIWHNAPDGWHGWIRSGELVPA